MSWLARLKLQQTAGAHPTKPTKPGYVGFVGAPDGLLQKTQAEPAAANDEVVDPDRWCWPHSSALTGLEIDTFQARLARFTDMGLDLETAEKLADTMAIQDRERDERHSCLECTHLQSGWRCRNWQVAGVALHPQDSRLPRAVALLLQRCDGFLKHTSGIDAHVDGHEQHDSGDEAADMHELPDA